MIIILAAVVILTLSKNNPIESAKEAAFKEDLRAVQDQVEMYIASRYQKELNDFDKNTLNISGETLVSDFGMPVKYKDKVAVKKGKVIYKGKDEKEIEWAKSIDIGNGKILPRKEWEKYIEEETEEGVPIPKGFTYKEGTKATGVVIEDGSHNEFVWIPSTESEYVKDFSFSSSYSATSSNTSEESFLSNLDETADVKKYVGFYIGRYEATIPEGATSATNTTGVPTCQKRKTVWTNISQTNSKANAESMYTGENSSVQSGLLTGKAWDRTCHWISDYQITIDEGTENERKETIDINNSVKYGNYKNSQSPANTGTYTANQKQLSRANDNWKTKNIYDLAGNVWEWTYEAYSSDRVSRGGSYNGNGGTFPVSYRISSNPSGTYNDRGFRLRLYIKTN